MQVNDHSSIININYLLMWGAQWRTG